MNAPGPTTKTTKVRFGKQRAAKVSVLPKADQRKMVFASAVIAAES